MLAAVWEEWKGVLSGSEGGWSKQDAMVEAKKVGFGE